MCRHKFVRFSLLATTFCFVWEKSKGPLVRWTVEPITTSVPLYDPTCPFFIFAPFLVLPVVWWRGKPGGGGIREYGKYVSCVCVSLWVYVNDMKSCRTFSCQKFRKSIIVYHQGRLSLSLLFPGVCVIPWCMCVSHTCVRVPGVCVCVKECNESYSDSHLEHSGKLRS